MSKSQKVLWVRKHTARVGCLNCGAAHTVDRDEDGASIEQKRCQGAVPDLCTVELCSSCRLECFNCNLPACEDHSTNRDGRIWCHSCVDAERREERIERCAEHAEEHAGFPSVAEILTGA